MLPLPSERSYSAALNGSAPSSSSAALNGYVKKYVHENGDVYEGEWVAGHREGRGRLVYTNGAVYEGQFCADKKSGRGTYFHASGDRYTGEWKSGKYDGRGAYTTASGEVMVSRYAQGAAIGDGAMFGADGLMAVRLLQGTAVDEITTEEARRISRETVGLRETRALCFEIMD